MTAIRIKKYTNIPGISDWYANRIGETFHKVVRVRNRNVYWVEEADDYVPFEDCEEIEPSRFNFVMCYSDQDLRELQIRIRKEIASRHS